MEFNLKKILLALLGSTSEPLAVRDVQTVITRYHARAVDEEGEDNEEGAEEPQGLMRELLDQVPSLLTAAQIREGMSALSAELQENDGPWRILEGPAGYRLVVAPAYANWVRLLRDEPRPQRLSTAALETLSVIAYRQPVTRSEIEAIRGVSADSAVNKLLEKDLIAVTGRAELPGRPLQYGTTEQFLEFCGIRSLEELPASDVLTPNQITEWIRQATAPTAAPTASDMGLPE
jgi:segregation and condensation protein B